MDRSHLREKQLIQADKMSSLGIPVAGVAHEINNPATSIMLNAPNLTKAWDAFLPILDIHFHDNPSVRVCNMAYPELRNRIELMLSAIQDGSARIKGIISELKNFSRPTRARMDHAIDVNQVVEKSLDLTAAILKKSTACLYVTYGKDFPMIRGNLGKLQQDLLNAKQVIEAVMTEDARILIKPAPQVYVLELGLNGVKLGGRCWVNNAKYWVTKCELQEKIKLRFDAEFIKFVYPQMNVYHRNDQETPPSQENGPEAV